MLYFENDSTDPTFNLALEEFLFRERDEEILLLWRNAPTVVVGKYQDTAAEIDTELVERYGIHVVRRITGGGAVYHDLGNLNYTFLSATRDEGFDFKRFTEPVIRTFALFGVRAENGGRNDILIDGKKISGNAQYKRKDRVLHHGTILFNVDLSRMAEVLRAPSKSYLSRATPSVRSRVANVAEYLSKTLDILAFRDYILEETRRSGDVRTERLTHQEVREIEKLRDEKYRNREWTYGSDAPPSWNQVVRRKFDWGNLEIRLSIENETIADCAIYGDFFTTGDPAALAAGLVGFPFRRAEFTQRLDEQKLRDVFPLLSPAEFSDLLFEENGEES